MTRTSWRETWLAVADAVAKRSLCVRNQVGAVIVSPTNRVVATGYNGPPAGLRPFTVRHRRVKQEDEVSCLDYPCPRAANNEHDADYSSCIAVHAEANALMFTDRRSREGGTLYCTHGICTACAKLVANSGLRHVVMRMDPGSEYRDTPRAIDFLRNCDLIVEVIE